MSLIFPYVKTEAVYKCPADPNKTKQGVPTIRSYAANDWMNPTGIFGDWIDPVNYMIFKKQTDIPRPTDLYILIEEGPTLNDCYFCVLPDGKWRDLPATYHGNSCAILFADGHAEFKTWTDSVVLGKQVIPGQAIPANPSSQDFAWLSSRATVHR